MNADELIVALQRLTSEQRKLPVGTIGGDQIGYDEVGGVKVVILR